jgi:hypothetical protein
MGFGAIITGGEGFEVLDRITRWIVEARVEMDLSKPAKFAIRFEDDICDGRWEVASEPALWANQMIGIFVSSRNALHCLVYGPITKVRTSSMIGGTGSWLEVHGEDRRVVMSRSGGPATWTGRASKVATAILEAYGLAPDVQITRIEYDDQHALNQRVTDLAFLEDIARRNVLEFWLEYEVSNIAGGITCTPKAKMKSPPPLPEGFQLEAKPPVLSADGDYVIDVHPPADTCVKVTKFDIHVDFERPNAAHGFAQPLNAAEPVTNEAQSEQAPITADWSGLQFQDDVRRRAVTDPAPDPDEDYLTQQAALTEAAWFVDVDCSSTLEMLDFVVRPHMIVSVQHVDPRLAGAYQVKAATHVINAADHFIDFKLRANGLGSSAP